MNDDSTKIRLKDYPDVLDASQLSEFLGVSKKTVYALLKNNEIPSVKVGRAYKIPKIYILKFLKIAQ